MSNYCTNAVRVIDTKCWIKWPDDSQCQNQSVNMPPWGDRDTSIFSWYLIYLLITEHLIPTGKCVHLLWSNGQDPLLNANDSQTDKSRRREPVSVGFLFESWYFWKPMRDASTNLYLSPSSSTNTLRCDCFRFNIKRKKSQYRKAFTWYHFFTEWRETDKVQIVPELCKTNHSPWWKKIRLRERIIRIKCHTWVKSL